MRKRIEMLEEKWERGVMGREGGRKIEAIEERVKILEERGGDTGLGRIEGGDERGEEERVRAMEEKEEELESEIEGLIKKIGAEIKIEAIRKVGKGKEGGREIELVQLESEEDKKRIMERKKGLKGEKIWIMYDLTWKERRVMEKIRDMAKQEEGKGARI
ncbi:hypothetical protein ALC57_08556 [Trachymyrmex cornetzi]|uniref:Uncharacterized protein n=1 Tax=Trachymyrmex cornetzi TaxID=471704 RepID=A0A151J6U3_9HYME|nr:hypothetical protein ALC57_08556 [Trachymyrmex cornetzi]